ncbi:hypothetical protein V7x_42960 [Crateriforma conspicua]|uniref:DUF4886 domain-containing protein n=1 Tax=Crateriforma conspicua TaxID=2527996 RepID=A0A5C6FR09_9PLAN|nr:DUF4886 domain-containing protein [Crateriforma conspicua]TWU62561.1 hypothetical protein V7x_42960 [Crateriforma conspicua]
MPYSFKKCHAATTIAVFVALISTLGVSTARAEQKTVRLLTIGNSFADNALTYLPQIVESDGHQLLVGRANLGGSTLERHWKHVCQFEADPSNRAGSPYGGGKLSLKDMLTKETWDFITIQQVSYKSHDPQTYQPFADNLHDYIRKHAPGATILVHQVWAYRIDDARFNPANEGREPHTQAAMYQQVRMAYHLLAQELNLGILPSGDAMYRADTDKDWGYRIDNKFDFRNAFYPDLPDQTHSLHAGWTWKKQEDGTRKLKLDGHHASSAGKFLLGCVWYEKLFQQYVMANSFLPQDMAEEYAVFLRKTAHQAVSGNLSQDN